MATLFADGFDWYSSTTDIGTSPMYPRFAVGSLSTTTAFGTGQSLQNMVANYNQGIFITGTNEATVYGSLRLYKDGPGTANQYFYITLTDGGFAQTTIRWNADGSISLYTGSDTGTLIQTYSGQYNINSTWNSFQFKVVINDTIGSIELRLNGSAINFITQTGINTRGATDQRVITARTLSGSRAGIGSAVVASDVTTRTIVVSDIGAVTVVSSDRPANNWANGFTFASVAAGGFYLDDLFMANTDWTGDMRALQQVPTTTTQSQFSASPVTGNNATNVDDPQQDGDTSYIFTNALVEDKYALSAISPIYVVTAVQYYACWKKPDVGPRTAVLSVAAHGSADTAVLTDSSIPNTYSYRFKIMDVDPTSATWTPANVNGAIVGISITG